jgi:hypothetical protein
MVRLHGEGVDWRMANVHLMALYASGGRTTMDGESMIPF